jgi:hypothetical protein
MTPSQRERKLDRLEALLRERRNRPRLVWSQPKTEQEHVDLYRRMLPRCWRRPRELTAEESELMARVWREVKGERVAKGEWYAQDAAWQK